MHADRPSLTALKVARGLLLLDAQPEMRPLLPEGAAAATRELLRAAGLLPAWNERLIGSRRFHRLVGALDRAAPGTTRMLGLRKRFFDDEVGEAGADVLVVLGAGFDTLALRAARRGIPAVEIDHPATSRVKRAAIARLDAPDALDLVAADLSLHGASEILATSRHHPHRGRTLVVAEGLLMYLPEEAIVRLFTGLHAALGPGSRVAFSYLERETFERRLGRLHGLTQASFQLLGEPLHWTIREDELEGFFAATGWTYRPDPRFDVSRYLRGTPLAGAPTGVERVAAVERG